MNDKVEPNVARSLGRTIAIAALVVLSMAPAALAAGPQSRVDQRTLSVAPNANENIVWGTAVHDGNIVLGTDCGVERDNIVWGTVDALGNIVWGTLSDDENIVWGTRVENIVWGTVAENIVWGTLSDHENIVWGTNVENIVWGTVVTTGSCGAPPLKQSAASAAPGRHR